MLKLCCVWFQPNQSNGESTPFYSPSDVLSDVCDYCSSNYELRLGSSQFTAFNQWQKDDILVIDHNMINYCVISTILIVHPGSYLNFYLGGI